MTHTHTHKLLTWQIAPMGSNLMVISLPNRDELSLRTVFAFPNDSRIGLAYGKAGDIRGGGGLYRGSYVVCVFL